MHTGRVVEPAVFRNFMRKSRKRAPQERARDRVLAILESASALVAMADHSGALTYVNPAGRAILGLTRNEAVSDIALIECIAPGVRTGIAEAAIPAALNSGVWSGDCILLARDGSEVEVSLLITAHRDAKGQLEGLSLLAQQLEAWTGTAVAARITRNEMLRVSARHITVQENERRRIAAELHDGLGQSIGLVIVSLETMADLLEQGEPEKAAACLDRLNPKVRDTLDELRRIAMNLRPAMLDSLGIVAAVSWHLRELEAACPDLEIERKISVDETDVPDHLRTPIFRILQEAGSNAIAHGKAARITVCLGKTQGVLELAVEDNGSGFDPEASPHDTGLTRGLGLQSMRERAELSCGIFEITSAPRRGTRVCVRWPASLEDTDPVHAAAPQAEVLAPLSPRVADPVDSRDLELLRNLSVCVACVRSIQSDG